MDGFIFVKSKNKAASEALSLKCVVNIYISNESMRTRFCRHSSVNCASWGTKERAFKSSLVYSSPRQKLQAATVCIIWESVGAPQTLSSWFHSWHFKIRSWELILLLLGILSLLKEMGNMLALCVTVILNI